MAARRAHHLTQEQFAELVGVSVSEISRVETGRNSTTIDTLLKFCEALDIGLDYLLYDLFPEDTAIRNPDIKLILEILDTLDEKSLQFILDFLLLYTRDHSTVVEKEREVSAKCD